MFGLALFFCLNESPSEKEGKYGDRVGDVTLRPASMKVPPKRKGNDAVILGVHSESDASMKVPPKRKGNHLLLFRGVRGGRLNESPSEKEGK